MIRLEHISKTFRVGKNKIEALKDVSLEVNKGEIFGVIGFSGAGKSTLIRCINLLERPTNGKVFVEDRDVLTLNKKDLRKLRRKIGMIFQGYNLLETATVYENIATPLRLEGVSKDEIKQRAEKYLDIVGLTDRRNAFPSQLSGGQKQRVAIARALAHEPEILLSDEATSALDPNTTDAILELLLRVNKELGITIFLITHELNVIQRICDRVAVMENGKVVEQGSVVDVFTRPQQAMTKQFISNEAKFAIPVQLKGELLKTGKLVKLTFLGESSKDPVLATLAKQFDVLPSIIAGGIDQLKDQSVGNLLVHIKGDQSKVETAVKFLHEQDVLVEEVNE
ncbi:methionine ABC transporter ATP-binding protein [Sporolactobacillus terrae]|uniref:Methionine ABC transporter ATP-binding protein n=1 Tax=Sporolactobacillus terrae TaxID=269673 RepID=A0A410DC01_9BACL|nr:ATP-binding cassette domain-containing protein [Sporolactobacillus terrae]QAA23626.1 methionine ABC transporter ATP-binding protein [Sporolactobacillus terrae]QAA26596.1 methionine ABC transporter ATP-binding protein [Sporolactobacillus terrae]UAK15667.1 ATP-binding cassette domain-containing protein [Sporolactobacillus terrae]BBO00135.1 methionine import ATP-binding protein MetN 1 [Sporolactobacillus terrae]